MMPSTTSEHHVGGFEDLMMNLIQDQEEKVKQIDEYMGVIGKLYLMRRKSLEVLRKFHWIILGGRFNQLSHVSSPLLSKPGEYLIWRRNGRDYGLATKIHQEVLFSERGDGVAGIKRRRRDLSGDGVWILATTSKTSANLS
ncbi:hypothetical protein Tco_0002305 [Tanacetum coccineum]